MSVIFVVLSGAGRPHDRLGVQKHPAYLSRGRPPDVCGRGLELSLDDLLKDLFIQHEIRDGFPKPGVLLLHVFEPLGLLDLEATILFAPSIIRYICSVTPIDLAAMPTLSPWLSRTSASLSFAMISSGLARLAIILLLL